MLSADVRYERIDSRQWANLLRLTGIFEPPRPAPRPATPPATPQAKGPGRHGPVILFVQDGMSVRAVDLKARRAFPAPPWEGPGKLAALRRELRAPWMLVVEDDALAEVLADVEGALRFDEDQLADGLRAIRAVRERIRAGAGLHFEPQPFRRIPLPSDAMLRRAVDLLWPAETAICLYLFEDGQPWTSLVLGRDAEGRIDLVTTDLALRTGRGAPPARRVSDRRGLTRAIERFADRPLHFGLFADRRSLERVLNGPDGTFEAERARERFVVDPAPMWLRGVLGVSDVARKARGAAGLLAAFAPKSVRDLAGRMTAAAGGLGAGGPLDALRAQLKQLLGFDPFAEGSPILAALQWLRETVTTPSPAAGGDVPDIGET